MDKRGLGKDRDLIRSAFALTVRRLRSKLGLSQETLAHQTGLGRGYMSGLERGKNTPTIETIWRLLPGLQVSFVEFAQEFERAVERLRGNRKPTPSAPEA